MLEKDDTTCLRAGDSDKPVLLKPGIYKLGYKEHRTTLAFGRQPKVEVVFCVMDGHAMGQTVRRFYRVRQLTSKPKNNGTFKAGWNGELLHEFVTLFGERPERLDRIPMTRFKNRIVRGRVKTVKQTSKQRTLPELLQYSIVESLLGLEE